MSDSHVNSFLFCVLVINVGILVMLVVKTVSLLKEFRERRKKP